MWTLTQTHKTAFIVTPHQALTKALARFTPDKSVNKSLRLHIYTGRWTGADVQIRCWGGGGDFSFWSIEYKPRACSEKQIQLFTWRTTQCKTIWNQLKHQVLLSKCIQIIQKHSFMEQALNIRGLLNPFTLCLTLTFIHVLTAISSHAPPLKDMLLPAPSSFIGRLQFGVSSVAGRQLLRPFHWGSKKKKKKVPRWEEMSVNQINK